MILSICIPTYNRAYKLKKLLYFLDNEIRTANIGEIELLIGDNCSTDDTENIVFDFMNNLLPYSCRYYKNERNLGLVGNLFELNKKARGAYIWWLGDDDLYHLNIVRKVFEEVQKNVYSFIFINHCGYKKTIDDGTGFCSAIDGVDISKESKNILLDIYDASGTTLMYISATVHRRSSIVSFLEEQHSINLATPFYLSYYSASKGRVKVIPDVLIDNVWGDISWSDKRLQVFCFQVPRVFCSLIKLRYPMLRIIKCLLLTMWTNKGNYVRYLFHVKK